MGVHKLTLGTATPALPPEAGSPRLKVHLARAFMVWQKIPCARRAEAQLFYWRLLCMVLSPAGLITSSRVPI